MAQKLLNLIMSLFTRLLFRRCMNNLAYCPPSANPVGHNPVGHPDLLGKFGHAHLPSGVLHHSIRTFIALLLCLCSPSTVFLEVPKVVVFPVDGMLVRRGVPHVFNEVLVNLPPFTDGDVPFSISAGFKGFIAGSPSTHVDPDAICTLNYPASVSTSCCSMNNFCLRQGFIGAILAASTSLRAEGVAKDIFNRTAIAEACPACVPTFSIGGRSTYNLPFSKSLPRDVLDIRVVVFDSARLEHNSVLVLAHGVYGLSSSERQSRLTAGACASSHKLTHAST